MLGKLSLFRSSTEVGVGFLVLTGSDNVGVVFLLLVVVFAVEVLLVVVGVGV